MSSKIEGELFIAGLRIPRQRAFDLAGTITQAETRWFEGQALTTDEGAGDDVIEGDRSEP